jgi:hypothetical protein
MMAGEVVMGWMGIVAVAGLVSGAGLAGATGLLEAARAGEPPPASTSAPGRRIALAAATSDRPRAGEKGVMPPRRKAPGSIPAAVALLMLVGAGPKGR